MRDKQIKSLFTYFENRQLNSAAPQAIKGGGEGGAVCGKLSKRSAWECCTCLCFNVGLTFMNITYTARVCRSKLACAFSHDSLSFPLFIL